MRTRKTAASQNKKTPTAKAPATEPHSEPAVEQEKASTEDVVATPPTKGAAAPKKKVIKTRKVIKKVLRPKTPALAKVAETEDGDDMSDAKDEQSLKAQAVPETAESEEHEEPGIQKTEELGDAQEKAKSKMDVDDLSTAKTESPVTEIFTKSIEGQEEVECEEPIEKVDGGTEMLESEKDSQDQLDNMDDVLKLEIMEDNQKSENVNDGHTEKAEEASEMKEDDATVSDEMEKAVEQEKASTKDVVATTPTKRAVAPKKKVIKTRKVIKKVLRPKTPASAKAGSASTVKVAETEGVKVDQDDDMTDAKDEPSLKAEVVPETAESEEHEELDQKTKDLGDAEEKAKSRMDVDDLSTAKTESPVTEVVAKLAEEPIESIEGQEEIKCEELIEKVDGATEMLESEKEPQDQLDNVDDVQKLENKEDNQKSENMNECHSEKAEEVSGMKEDYAPVSDEIVDYGDEEGFVEPGDEDLREDDEPKTTDDVKTLNEENKELAATAKECKVKKEHEIFVDGLDREVSEEDVKKAFEKAGEVVEVRLLKYPSTNKNRGFAIVRFATKDQAKKALSEMKNPVIRGKQCGTAPNEDNHTLFVGNICNTWTKEAIIQKLKDSNVEGVESITLVQDPRQFAGLSRGFCFVQFVCHADAMNAYKRLQKPDAVFGHAERTVKVAFAEPLQEPDPEVMAKVKSVFIDGLPPYWDEDCVRKHFKGYGEIERVTLARNKSTATRKDFGFVDYTTHEAAIACIEDVNRKELVDGNSTTKVRARLSNPSPKMQAVKGGMRGGFRIGNPAGRSLGRPGPPVDRPNFQYGRMPRVPFNDPGGPYVRRVPHRGGHGAPEASVVGRPNFGGPRHVPIERGPVRPFPQRREPFPLDDGGYSRPFMGRHYDDPYMYDGSHGLKRPFHMTEQGPTYVYDGSHGQKRPFHMTEQGPTYMEPSQVRARFDYTGTGRGSHVRDTFGAGSSMYSSGTGYYSNDYGPRPHSSFNTRDRSYGSAPSGRGGGSGYYY